MGWEWEEGNGMNEYVSLYVCMQATAATEATSSELSLPLVTPTTFCPIGKN